jgi:hypothetical protein
VYFSIGISSSITLRFVLISTNASMWIRCWKVDWKVS